MNMKMKMNSLYKLILTSSIILILSIACITSSNPINFNISLYQPMVDRYQTKDITKDAYILNFWFPLVVLAQKNYHISKNLTMNLVIKSK